MKRFDLLNDLKNFSNHWTISGFRKAYPDSRAINSTAIAMLSSDINDSEKTRLAIIRLNIEDSLKLENEQNYIIALRFYNFGQVATLDLISLDASTHEEIVTEHLKRLNVPQERDRLNPHNTTKQIPFLIAGGLVKKTSDNCLKFSSSSYKYGMSMFFADSNSIAAYVANACELMVDPSNNIQGGKDFIRNILEFMLEMNDRANFYEQFSVKALSEAIMERGMNANQINALLMMKVLDRHVNEGGDVVKIVINEMADGFSSHFLRVSLSMRMQRSEN